MKITFGTRKSDKHKVERRLEPVQTQTHYGAIIGSAVGFLVSGLWWLVCWTARWAWGKIPAVERRRKHQAEVAAQTALDEETARRLEKKNWLRSVVKEAAKEAAKEAVKEALRAALDEYLEGVVRGKVVEMMAVEAKTELREELRPLVTEDLKAELREELRPLVAEELEAEMREKRKKHD